VHPQLEGDPAYRPAPRRRISAQLDGHPRGPLTQLVAVLPRCSHSFHPSWIESLHQTRGDSRDAWIVPLDRNVEITTNPRS
jgi:hypothetical protein